MDKLKMQSVDIVSENIDKLSKLFPNCITESSSGKAIDFDQLKHELSADLIEGNKERYRLEWPGKREAIVLANLPSNMTLRPIKDDSVDFDTTENIYIEGENLQVLKLLQESYLGKIKMIYIDPPYNTGNDFIYKDNFTKDKSDELFESGQKNELDQRLVANLETSGRYHSDWLSMMYPRLKLARNLLTDDGVVFISIDENEVHNLRKICDEIFGEINFINEVSINMKNIAGASGGGEDKKLKKNIEYLLIYSKNYNELSPFNNIYDYVPIHELTQKYRDEGVSWKYTTALIHPGSKEYIGSTKDGDGNEIKIYKRVNPEFKTINQLMLENNISEQSAYQIYGHMLFQTAMPQSSIRPRVMGKVAELGINHDLYSIEYVPRSGKNKGQMHEQFYKGDSFRLFAWLKDVSEEINGVLCKKEMKGTFWDFTGDINNLSKEGNITFPNGKKPLAMMKRLIEMINDPDAFYLDFFSGSASLAHGVIESNVSDNGNRKFILVQIPELIDEENINFQDGLKNICEIGKERIRRAVKKIKEETNVNIDYGFRVYRLDVSNMQDVYYHPQDYDQSKMDAFVDNVKPDRSADDLLAQVMIDWGLPLSLKIEKISIAGKQVYKVDNDSLYACFDKSLDEDFAKDIAKEKPLRIVCRDNSFKDNSAKINVKQLLKQLSPETELKVI